jgi:prophage regulatory protein
MHYLGKSFKPKSEIGAAPSVVKRVSDLQTGTLLEGFHMSKQSAAQQPGNFLIRIDEVLRRVPVSRSSLYEGISLGIYPRPVRIGKRTVAWRSRDIDELIGSFK